MASKQSDLRNSVKAFHDSFSSKQTDNANAIESASRVLVCQIEQLNEVLCASVLSM